jgi:type I restriction enzyme S subunit
MSGRNVTEIGKFPKNWELKKLSEITDKKVTYGIVQPGFHDDEGVPILRVNNIKGGTIQDSEVMKVSLDIASKYKRTELKGDEILITLVGNLGEVAIVSEKYKGWNIARAVGKIELKDKSDNDWVAGWLTSAQLKHYIKTHANTTVQHTLNLSDVENLPIIMPPKNQRDALAYFISIFNKKTTLLRYQNQTLEELAQTLFKRWFVEFEFPNDEGQPYKSSGGKMVESELGEIPERWRVGEVSDHVDHSTKSVSPGKEPDKVYHHYSIPAFDSGRYPTLDRGETILSNKYKVIKNSILVSKLNPRTSRIWTVFQPKDNAICSTEIQVFIPQNNKYAFAFGLFQHASIRREMAQRASGTSSSHQRVRPGDILNIECVVPPNEVLEKFENAVLHTLRKVDKNQNEIQSLTQLRDTLLPKLMSGELRVKN